MNFRSQLFYILYNKSFLDICRSILIFHKYYPRTPKAQRYISLSMLLGIKTKCISCSSVNILTILIKVVYFSFHIQIIGKSFFQPTSVNK